MATKRKKFSVVKAVKSAAREKVGTPPPTRREEGSPKKKQRGPEKHKPTLGKLLAED